MTPAPLPPGEDKPGVPFAPPFSFLVPLLALLALEWVVPTAFAPPPWRWVVGGALCAGGVTINVSAALTQKRAGTDFIPDRPSTTIVSTGPYAWTRNPMYVGFALLTAGLATLADSLLALAALPIGLVVIDRLIIAREERYLERKFGEEYLSYKRRVRRWL